MCENSAQFDYPVEIDKQHTAFDTAHFTGNRFECAETEAYTHPAAWPTWDYCPYCGSELPSVDTEGENGD